MKKKVEHIIKTVLPGSIAEECGFEPGDVILKINDCEIDDIFDYQFYTSEEFLDITVRTKQGEEVTVEIEKDSDEELGIEYENEFMDNFRSCHNKCIFCFIDQMPPGMRESLYFKDDDSRLSFLQGNYVTLTNMSEKDVDRIIRYNLEPINISFQTMNPELRCKMLNNRFAGDALQIAYKLRDAGITMNGQIVLCKGYNDGEELEYSLSELYSFLPNLQSLSVVPVGLSKYRDGLCHLEPFTKEEAIEVIAQIEKWQNKAMEEFGCHFVHASDEWYLLAGMDLPDEDSYDGYLQFENGVGMLRSLINEVSDAIIDAKDRKTLTCNGCNFNCPRNLLGCEKGRKIIAKKGIDVTKLKPKTVSMATGKLAYETICELAKEVHEAIPQIDIKVYCITNNFFGEMITVSGLVTATDLMEQLKGKDLGEKLILPANMMRSDEPIFLDDYHLDDVVSALQVPIDIVKSNGYSFVEKVIYE